YGVSSVSGADDADAGFIGAGVRQSAQPEAAAHVEDRRLRCKDRCLQAVAVDHPDGTAEAADTPQTGYRGGRADELAGSVMILIARFAVRAVPSVGSRYRPGHRCRNRERSENPSGKVLPAHVRPPIQALTEG